MLNTYNNILCSIIIFCVKQKAWENLRGHGSNLICDGRRNNECGQKSARHTVKLWHCAGKNRMIFKRILYSLLRNILPCLYMMVKAMKTMPEWGRKKIKVSQASTHTFSRSQSDNIHCFFQFRLLERASVIFSLRNCSLPQTGVCWSYSGGYSVWWINNRPFHQSAAVFSLVWP